MPFSDDSQPTDNSTRTGTGEPAEQAVTPYVNRDVSRNGKNVAPDSTALGLNDPRTKLLVEKMLVALAQENVNNEDKAVPRFSMVDYMAVMQRRWLPMLLVFFATLAVVAWRLKPGEPLYSATATMLLAAPSQSNDLRSDPLKIAVDNPLGQNISTKIALVTSRQMIDRAMARLDKSLRLRGWEKGVIQRGMVTAAAPVSPDLIDITVTAHDPEAAKALSNTLIAIYAERTRELVRESYKDSIGMLGQQKIEAEKLLIAAKKEFQEFKTRTQTLSIGSRMDSAAAALQQLELEAQQARQELDAGAASRAIQSDEQVTQLQGKALAARARYEATLRDFLPDSPEATAARTEWQEAQTLLKQRISALQQIARQRSTSAQSRLEQSRRTAAELPTLEYKYRQLESKVNLLQSTYDALSDRYTSVSLAQFTEKSDAASVLTPATAALPIGRTWTQALITALLCALILSVLMGLMLEQFDNTLHTSEELEARLGVSVIGSIPIVDNIEARRGAANQATPGAGAKAPALAPPVVPPVVPPMTVLSPIADAGKTVFDESLPKTPAKKAQRGQGLARLHSSHILLEAFRIIRTNLAFSTVDAPLCNLLITSADAGEGKSFCALNLAAVMAYEGKRVILLDCDLRRPSQHLLSALPLHPGFTNTLMGECTIEECLRESAVPNLHIMTAGAVPPNPPELLGSVQGRHLIERLQEYADIVIIDSPPVASLSDAQVLSSIADAVLLVVGASSTNARHILRAQANIRNAGGRLLGVLFNKAGRSNDPYYGNYSYGYTREGDDHAR